jgi:hypothetical protein
MLVKLKANVPEIILGALLAVAVFAMGMAFESSRHPPSNNYSGQATKEGSAPIAAEHGPDKVTDWLLVFLNVFLVGSTLLLWRANNRSAKIAERALNELEAPFIGLKILNTGLRCAWKMNDDYIVEKALNGLSYCFVNYGRTAGVLLALKDKLQVCPAGGLPSLEWPAERDKPYPYGVLIGPDKESAESFRVWDDFIDKNEWMTFEASDADLFLVGRLQYRDIFGSVFEIGFCAVYVRETGGFLMKGGRDYNYSHKIS